MASDAPRTSPETAEGNNRHLTSSKTGTLYFAFGSNLSAVQMGLRLSYSKSSSVPVALARLDGYKWIICERGYANVVAVSDASTSSKASITSSGNEVNGDVPQSSESTAWKRRDDSENVVWGILYNMSPEDESTLDQYEGHDEWRNSDPDPNPDVSDRMRKPFLQGDWDYNKLYLDVRVTKWLRDARGYGIDVGTSDADTANSKVIVDAAIDNGSNAGNRTADGDVVRALVYTDEHRVSPGEINAEYIGRMNRGIDEATRLGLPTAWVEKVMRKWIPEGVFVDDEEYVGTDRGYVEAERGESLEGVRERVLRKKGDADAGEGEGEEWKGYEQVS